MRYFVSGFLSALAVRLRDVKSWAVLLLLPVLVLAAGRLLPAQEVSAPVQVGVALPESGGEALWSLLESRSGAVLTFILADTQTIDRNVAAGRWDCGLVPAADFEERLAEQDLDGIITIRIGAGSTVYPLVRETVSACMAQLVGPDIARAYLEDSGIASGEVLLQIRPLEESERVRVSMSTSDGSPLSAPELAEDGIDAVLCWMVSAVMLVRLLLGAADLGKWITSPAVVRMKPLRRPACLMAARAGAEGFLMVLAGALAMLLLGKGLWGCGAVLAYVLFWLAASVLLAHFEGISSVLPVCVPFAAVASLLLSSALVDISLIVPALSGVSRWFPAALFLRICRGEPAALAILLAQALVCFAASAAADRR